MNANENTLDVVEQMFTEDEVTLDEDGDYSEHDGGDINVRSIAEALMAENVRVKKITINVELSIEDAQALRDAFQVNTSVKELDLAYISVDCFVTLAQGIAVGQTVKKFTVEEMFLDETEEDLRTFQAGLRLIALSVEELLLCETSLGDAGARVLAEILRDRSSFRELTLHNCKIGSEGTDHLGGALRVNTSLQVFKLSNNSGNAGVISLFEGLMGNQTLRVLHLDNCGMVGRAGVAAVGRLLEANTTIEELDISCNHFGAAGCSALVDGLSRNQGLRVLILERCEVGNDGAKQIGRTLKTNSHLERLMVGGNGITEEGFEALVEGLSSNTTLLEIVLDWDGRDPRFPVSVTLANRVEVYLSANRFLRSYRSRKPAAISPFLLSLILTRVSNHPAAHYMLTREHIPDLLASSAGSSTNSAATGEVGDTVVESSQDGSGRKRKGDRL
jgi:hypothetical protein